MGLKSVLVWLKAGYEDSRTESTTVQGRGGDFSWDPHLNDRIWSMEDSGRKGALSQLETQAQALRRTLPALHTMEDSIPCHSLLPPTSLDPLSQLLPFFVVHLGIPEALASRTDTCLLN